MAYTLLQLYICVLVLVFQHTQSKVFYVLLQYDFTDGHTVLQLLECEFHSVDYHTMLDVVTGLKTAITLLEKVSFCITNMHDCVFTFVVSTSS